MVKHQLPGSIKHQLILVYFFMRDQGLFKQFIGCNNHMQSPALFKNILKFCTFLSKFWTVLSLFALFNNFLPIFALFLKNCTHALLSRIGPGDVLVEYQNYSLSWISYGTYIDTQNRLHLVKNFILLNLVVV